MQPDEPPPVWPDPEGQVRGYEFSPLYSSVPHACKADPKLYELLALVEAFSSMQDQLNKERQAMVRHC